MIWLFTAAVVMVVAALVVLIVEVLIPRGLVILGNLDTWWSPFRTKAPPGEMYVMVKGSPTGPFDRVIESVLDYDYDDVKNEFYNLASSETPPTPRRGVIGTRRREGYLEGMGLVWVGFQKYRLMREIVHTKWVNLPGEEGGRLETKIRPGPSIFFRYNMAAKIEAAEILGNVTVDSIVVFTAQLKSPAKALFLAGGWERQLNSAVQSRFRRFASRQSLEGLLQEQVREGQEADSSVLVAEFMDLNLRGTNNQTETSLPNLYGVEIIDVRLVKTDVVGSEEVKVAVQAEEVATRLAAAARRRGEGDRDERIARAAGVKAEVEAWGASPVGAQVAMAEAIKVAKPNVLGGGVIASVESRRTDNT